MREDYIKIHDPHQMAKDISFLAEILTVLCVSIVDVEDMNDKYKSDILRLHEIKERYNESP